MKSKIKRILTTLETLYPYDDSCFLNYEKEHPWQLLFATILSAQCTDACVNIVTVTLFERFPTLESFAEADIDEIEEIIRPTGFFRMKAKHLQESARKLLTQFGGVVPSDMESLTLLSGVGRKTANVVRCHIFSIPSITVDTHVGRVSKRLGLTENTDPVKAEFDLMEVLPKKSWMAYNQQIINHGRQVCASRAPKCDECALRKDCVHAV